MEPRPLSASHIPSASKASLSRTPNISTSSSRPWAPSPSRTTTKKVSCCGGALAFSEPEKSQALIKDIIESAYDGGADMIVTPCPVCQMNVEVYQDQINAKYGTKFQMPVTYYSTLMAVAYGKSGKQAGLDGQIIRAKQLEKIAEK